MVNIASARYLDRISRQTEIVVKWSKVPEDINSKRKSILPVESLILITATYVQPRRFSMIRISYHREV